MRTFFAWFNSWLISYVPTLIEQPKWFENDSEISVGDVVLILKSEQEFDQKYGIIRSVNRGRDKCVRSVEMSTKTITKIPSGGREVVVIHKVDELPSYEV